MHEYDESGRIVSLDDGIVSLEFDARCPEQGHSLIILTVAGQPVILSHQEWEAVIRMWQERSME